MARQEQLLVVEDDERIRELYSERLRELGLNVTAVANGAVALELLATRGFDVVILGLAVPTASGAELLRRMCATPGMAHAAVIVTTPVPQPLPRQGAASVRWLKKPVLVRDVVEAVLEALRGSASARAQADRSSVHE